MKNRKLLALVLCVTLMLSVGLTGCGGNKNVTMDKEQYLNLFLAADVKTLDSSKATDLYSTQIITETQEGLTRIENDGNKDVVKEAGAKSWDISADGLVWTFHLRDYKWSDDKPVTANDYVYGWRRLLDPKTASDYAYFVYCVKGAQEYNAGTGKVEDVGVKALDDKTFQITLNQPVPYFTQITAFKNTFPLRQDLVEAGGEKYGQDIAGVVFSGPFIIKEWVKGNKVVLEKNPKYWDANSVKLSKVTMQVVKEEASRMQMFESKQVDVAGARGEYLKKFKTKAEAGEFQYFAGYAPSESYEFFNCNDKNKLFTNAKVRLAFSLALDRDSYVKNVYLRGYPAYGWTPYALLNGDKEYRKEVPEPLKTIKDKDPKALFQEGLKELGLDPNGTYEVEYLSSGTDTQSRTMAEFDQNQWQTKLGVKVKLDAVNDFPQFLDRVDKGEFQIGGMGWSGDYNDPMTFFDMFTTGNGNNPGKWSNAKYDDLIKQATAETDFNKRLDIFKQCEQILVVDDCAISPSVYRDKQVFEQKYVKGLMLPLFGADYEFKYAYTEGRQ